MQDSETFTQLWMRFWKLHWAESKKCTFCGGVCGCTTCHVYIKSGMQNLSEMEENEEDRIDMADNLTLESRLACQCEIHGDVTVLIPDQSGFMGH